MLKQLTALTDRMTLLVDQKLCDTEYYSSRLLGRNSE